MKFSDDTAILSLLEKNSDISVYHSEIENFVSWCENNQLFLNVKKTVEMVFDPRGVGDHRPEVIHDEAISQVTSFKNLGVFIDNSLTWSTHTDILCSRLQQRLHFLRRLRVHGVDQKFMLVFSHAVSERYGINTCYCNLSVRLKSKLVRLMQTAWKVIGGQGPPTPAVRI